MGNISKPATRIIIEDFVKEIDEKKQRDAIKPQKAVIAFRNDLEVQRERDVYLVPIGLLRYRKDNGRICSDVLNFETHNYKLNEADEEDQASIKKFLEEKDKEKTDELKKSILHTGQRETAIITCDGFLINGNRRKMVLEILLKETQNQQKFGYMKVVILPKVGEEAGPPTDLEIEQIENRYQLQNDGKAEYYGFDRALSIRRKIYAGMPLEDQLRDDPRYVGLSTKEFMKIVKQYNNDYLEPLACVDRYLSSLGREGLYGTVSSGMTDREGKWQAFVDFNHSVYQKLLNEKERFQLGIEEDEVGDIEEIAYKMIRMREFPNLKLHHLMRMLPNLLERKDCKEELVKILDVDHELSEQDGKIPDGNDYEKKVDDVWRRKNGQTMMNLVMGAKKLFEHEKDRETPITLLEGALKKLNHNLMILEGINLDDLQKAMKLVKDIQEKANDLEHDIYHLEKNAQELFSKKQNKQKKQKIQIKRK